MLKSVRRNPFESDFNSHHNVDSQSANYFDYYDASPQYVGNYQEGFGANPFSTLDNEAFHHCEPDHDYGSGIYSAPTSGACNDTGASEVLSNLELNYDNPYTSKHSREPYPAWTCDEDATLSIESIEEIFISLTDMFGFQRDSMRNMFDHFMTLLDSRASRMPAAKALESLHADYIGGDHANYRKWYFAAYFDLEPKDMNTGNTLDSTNPGVDNSWATNSDAETMQTAEERWRLRMKRMAPEEQARQLALYLLCWGEANQVRFMPECLCFIFKCADDFCNIPNSSSSESPVPNSEIQELYFLNHIITPIYYFLRDQGYEVQDGVYVRRDRDHDKVVGYDDCNQLFWYGEGLRSIVLHDKTQLIDIPPSERYRRLGDVNWSKCFRKTYKESRSLFHLLVNFNRIWIIHLTVFWFYTAWNAPAIIVGPTYEQQVNQKPSTTKQLSMLGFGGTIAPLIQIIATLAEWVYVPRRWPGAQPLGIKFVLLWVALAINAAPGVKIYLFPGPKKLDQYLGMAHFAIATHTFLFLAIMPSGNLLGGFFRKKSHRPSASQVFTANYPKLHGNNVFFSYFFWMVVFGAKFGESWVFLALSLRDPIRYLYIMKIETCQGDRLLGSILCKHQPTVLLTMTVLTDLIFFFLDTYLWYILVNTICSILRSFYLGSSIWTPWRNVFSSLPKRIYTKILATSHMEIKYKPKTLVSQIWNTIVISLYREHLISIDQIQSLLYHQVPSERSGRMTLRAPNFFIAKSDEWFGSQFFPSNSEAERRISFFAQSLSTPMPETMSVDSMPIFTVMIPHYSEKILFSLREIIREEDHYSRLTMLEYLKQLHPHEWECFVKDTKTLADENEESDSTDGNDKDRMRRKIDDLPFYCIGFKSSAPEYALRTRIWASLRAQTLYRTVSGFINYSRAIELLYRVENPEVVQLLSRNPERLDSELKRMSRRRFRLVIAMQRYARFRQEELENTEFLLRAYPDVQIAYLDEDVPEDGERRVYSALVDGHSEVLENGTRKPKFRVQLSGNPILGDGKADNQNHALIFYRGEYIQLIDANQENYLEECLKIRSILAEFNEIKPEHISGYSDDAKGKEPIAIVGTREYIFSENVGVLGDIAAGKEQTFGTLFARTLAQLGGKLHYGHPDFINGIFMTTRGGVSKAQKGLHLNEDIYAGMNAIMRGGRIKHCEFYQCGKGRDLGFGSILNFVTKIGIGMGEQMLSREYYHLGTQLPLDRFLSFYYAHAGFHLNNVFIMSSIQMFLLTILNFGSLRHETIRCHYNRHTPITDPLLPTGCVNTDALMDWVYRCTLSIFLVFLMSFIPLTVQGLIENDPWRAALRFFKHISSLSPLFEVFVCQVYSSSLQQNLSFGGARYIGTGRGFATARIPFGVLYARFAGPSIYLGARLLMLILFATLTVWQPALVWFWVTTTGLIFSPFLYNPHQFAWDDFFIDYREYIRWLFRGHSRFHGSSWITFCRLSRIQVTGLKRKSLGGSSTPICTDASRPTITNLIFSEIIMPLLTVVATMIPYLYINAQTGVLSANNGNAIIKPTDALIRVLAVGFAPVAINTGTVAVMLCLSCLLGPLLSLCCRNFGTVLASTAYSISVVALILSFEVMLFLEGFQFTRALAGMIVVTSLQRFLSKFLIATALTREIKTATASTAFWTGQWYSLGRYSITQPFREFICKITESNMFAADFILGHLILFTMLPVVLVPKIDKVHTTMLFWLLPRYI